MGIDLKRCCACTREKPRHEFHKWSGSGDGLRAKCRACISEEGKIARKGSRNAAIYKGRCKGCERDMSDQPKTKSGRTSILCNDCRKTRCERCKNTFSKELIRGRKCPDCLKESHKESNQRARSNSLAKTAGLSVPHKPPRIALQSWELTRLRVACGLPPVLPDEPWDPFEDEEAMQQHESGIDSRVQVQCQSLDNPSESSSTPVEVV